MRMKYLNLKLLIGVIQFTVIAGCTKMDHTYKPFMEGGMKIYVGKPTGISVAPGRNRIKLAWPAPSDPSITTTRIYWNNNSDSIDVTTGDTDSLSVILTNMTEGTHNFTLNTIDSRGNRSLPLQFSGQVFGAAYESFILSRPVTRTSFDGNNLKVEWGGLSDTAIIGTNIIYKDANDVTRDLFVPKTEDITSLSSFLRGNITYRTHYMPVTGGIDTFYTPYTTQYIKGLPINLPKAGWKIHSYSSHDTRPGASFRPPENLLDGNITSIWVNFIGTPATAYPHWVVIDMLEVKENIEGFSFVQRTPLNGALKDIRLEGSVDGVNFTSYGLFTLANSAGMLYVDLPNPVNIRYFKLTGLNDYNNSANISLAEAGAFTR